MGLAAAVDRNELHNGRVSLVFLGTGIPPLVAPLLLNVAEDVLLRYRMGNMRGWGGPLSQLWISSQKDLQLKILARQRGLGMRPVLGAFAGFVPSAFAEKYPNASLTRAPAWANFKVLYLMMILESS